MQDLGRQRLPIYHWCKDGRDACEDRARCFKCHKLGHWARECTASWDSPRSAYRGTTFTPGYSYSPYRPVTELTLNPVQAVMSLMRRFDEEVAQIPSLQCVTCHNMVSTVIHSFLKQPTFLPDCLRTFMIQWGPFCQSCGEPFPALLIKDILSQNVERKG